MTDTDPRAVAQQLLDALQEAVRAKDHAATLALLTDDVALLGTAAANLDQDAVSAYLQAVFEQAGYVHWEWETVSVVDVRPGAITFVALGSVGLDEGADDYVRDSMRLTCLAVEDAGRWRLRLFHGSVPAV